MSGVGVSSDDDAPVAIQAPDIAPNINIGSDDPVFQAPSLPGWRIQAPTFADVPAVDPNDSVFQLPVLPAPSIMGGVDFSGSNLPVHASSAPAGQGSVPQPTARPYFDPQAVGIGTALGDTSTAVKAVHGAIGASLGLANKLGMLSGDTSALGNLKYVTRAITAPLGFAAGTAKDIGNGADPGEAVLGNGVREGLVMGATVLGDAVPGVGWATGPAAGWLANRYLPDGAAIGHFVIQNASEQPDFSIF
jgi:hypothetical protein